MKKIFIFSPIYNEEKTLPISVPKVIEWCTRNLHNYDWYYGIIDNASKDNSQKICKEFEKKYNNKFKYYRLEEKGKGLAINYGWTKVDFDYSVFMDIDLATDLKHLSEMIIKLDEGFDLVIGSRKMKESIVKNRTWKRTLASSIYPVIVRLLSGSKVKDFQCGFKGIRKSVAEDIMSATIDRKFAIDTEIIIVADKLNYDIAEIPVIWTDDVGSTVKLASDSKSMFLALINCLRTKKWTHKIDKLNYSSNKKLSKDTPYDKYMELLKFVIVGGTSFLIDFLLSITLKNILPYEIIKANLWGDSNLETLRNYQVAAIISFILASIYNFSINRKLTFLSHKGSKVEHMSKYIPIALFTGFILSPMILHILVEWMRISFEISLPIKSLLIMFMNYILHKKFTFK